MIYILIAIGLLAILTATLADQGGGQQSQTQNANKLMAELESQISFITNAINDCVLNYPDQDSKLTSTYQKNPPYPLGPSNAYFDVSGASPGSSATTRAEDIRCPGNPGGTAPNSQNHAFIFGGMTGKFFPSTPAYFDKWRYANGSGSDDGVWLQIYTTKLDSYIKTALTKLDAKYAPCEADFLDASSGDVPATSGGGVCASGRYCFYYRIIRKPNTPATPGCP